MFYYITCSAGGCVSFSSFVSNLSSRPGQLKTFSFKIISELHGKQSSLVLPWSTAARSEEAQAALLLLIADIRLDERVGDPGLHSVQGSFKVSGLDVLSFDVLL